jgi:hypothetical protein
MFGKPEWFREKKIGWKLTPTCWQGWAYALCWAAIVVLPFLLLLAVDRVPEAFVWLAVSSGTLVWDVRQLLGQIRTAGANEDVLYIADEDAKDSRVETPKYDLHLRA